VTISKNQKLCGYNDSILSFERIIGIKKQLAKRVPESTCFNIAIA